MFDSVRLNKYEGDYFHRGAVFRMMAEYPYEDTVDFMLILNSESPSGFSFIVTTGFKAGHLVCHLPQEAQAEDGVMAIRKQWLIDNWLTWVYPDVHCFEEIRVSNHYKI